jgi:hypothetical protein
MNDTATHAYIGICPQCQGWRLLTIDSPDQKKAVAKEVAQAIRDGLSIKRLLIDDARKILSCCCRKKRRHIVEGREQILPLFENAEKQ